MTLVFGAIPIGAYWRGAFCRANLSVRVCLWSVRGVVLGTVQYLGTNLAVRVINHCFHGVVMVTVRQSGSLFALFASTPLCRPLTVLPHSPFRLGSPTSVLTSTFCLSPMLLSQAAVHQLVPVAVFLPSHSLGQVIIEVVIPPGTHLYGRSSFLLSDITSVSVSLCLFAIGLLSSVPAQFPMA